MIHKKGDTTDPANFRPIALTSVIGKFFHKILANRQEHYLIFNDMVDKFLQKGFQSGINGCIEHVFAMQSMIINAMDHSLPLSLSFIDLKNAFGSISHNYISDIIKLIKLLTQFTSYLTNLYSSISAHISTKDWKTQPFPISKGIFQGDTLSPLLFLIAFNPIIQSVVIHHSRGFPLKIPNHTESNPPPTMPKLPYLCSVGGKKILKETLGWYLARVLTVDNLDRAKLQYKKGGHTEEVCLLQIKWTPAKGNGKWFLPGFCDPPSTRSNLSTLLSTASHTRSEGMQMTYL